MCRPFSFYAGEINGAVKIWWSQTTDSHSEIAMEFNLRDTGLVPLYAGEFFPDEAKPLPDPATWTLQWDSDATNSSRTAPPPELAASIRAEVEKIVPQFVVTERGRQIQVLARGWGFNEGQVICRENSRAVCRDNSSAVCRENSSAVCWNNSSAVCWNNSSAECWENSSAVCRDNSDCRIFDAAKATLTPGSKAVLIDRSNGDPVVTIAPPIEPEKPAKKRKATKRK